MENIELRDKIYSLFFFNPALKKIGISLLNKEWFTGNFIYRYFNTLNIDNIISKYKKRPNFVFIENTNLCNSHCVICPHDEMKRKKGIMKWELYKKIIDECKLSGAENISLHGFGEPFIDRDFIKKLAYAKKVGFRHIGTSTNGSLLTKNISKNLVKLEIDEIGFSIDAYSPQVYRHVRAGLSYEQVIKNIEDLLTIRRDYGKEKPKVIVDFVETKFNSGEKEKFIRKWKQIADEVNITTLHSWGGKYKEKTGDKPLHCQSKVLREPCRFLWTDMYINWDGRISACCQDYESELVIGDIKKNTLMEIWTGKTINSLRKFHHEGKADEIPLCRKCDYRSVWWLFK